MYFLFSLLFRLLPIINDEGTRARSPHTLFIRGALELRLDWSNITSCLENFENLGFLDKGVNPEGSGVYLWRRGDTYNCPFTPFYASTLTFQQQYAMEQYKVINISPFKGKDFRPI
jgi:hypothetical protein